MTESVICGTELILIARIEPDGTFTVAWDKMPGKFLFHDGFGALLRMGRGETEGMVELHRVRVDVEVEPLGHVEPLLP